jgi:hypothetical protein
MEVSGQLHAPHLFYPWERAPGTYWIGSWLGPRTSLDVVERRKIFCPCWESNPSHPASNLVSTLTEKLKIIELMFNPLTSLFFAVHRC